MCRMVLQISVSEEDAFLPLISGENSLLQQSIRDNTDRPNSDGWGVAVLDKNNNFSVTKYPQPAFLDKDFKFMAQHEKSRLIVAHARRGSMGINKKENTHPFHYGEWIFAHNGNIPSVKENRSLFLEEVDTCYIKEIKGDTDSEILFFILLTRLGDVQHKTNQEIVRIVDNTMAWVKEHAGEGILALNFFLVHPHLQIAYRFNRPLSIWETKRKIIVASEPLFDYNSWQEIPEDACLIIRDNQKELFELAGRTANQLSD